MRKVHTEDHIYMVYYLKTICMKKVLITLFLFSLIGSAYAQQQAGRLRLSFSGFKCFRETWDDAMQLDGKCDEVLLNFNFTMAAADGSTKFQYKFRSDTYGDANGAFSNRVSAGSCVDLFGGAKGGIKAGDVVTANKIIGEYDMAAGDALNIIPTIWEWDPGADVLSSVVGRIESGITGMNARVMEVVRSGTGIIQSPVSGHINSVTEFVIKGNYLNLPTASEITQTLVGKQASRPVGMTMDGKFDPYVTVLTTPIIKAMVNSDFGYGPGIIPVHYDEEELGNTRDHGSYVIFFKIEFMPTGTVSAVSPTTTTAVSGTVSKTMVNTMMVAPATTTTNVTTQTIQPVPQPAGSSTAAIPPALIGTWQGSFTEAGGANAKQIRFQLGTDSRITILSNNPKEKQQGSGTYTYDATGFRASFTDNKGVATNLAGLFNGSNQINGNWAQVGKSGTWTVMKN
jgi:hypothetical protein